MEVVHCPFQPQSLLLQLFLRARIHLKLAGLRRWCRWRADRWRTWRNLVRLRILFFLTTSLQQSKSTTFRRIKISRVPRRPPNLPTACHVPSSASSSTSSNASSPTKSLQSKENNEQSKSYLHPSSTPQESGLPLRQLDNTSSDLMPRWAQDCFYRTVVLGLKPLLLQDIPSSPNKPPKRSSSTCSIESTDSLETANELQACTLNDNQSKGTPVRRSVSIPDYRQVKEQSLSELTANDCREEEEEEEEEEEVDRRLPFINHLVDDLHKRLNELEVLYATISQSSDTRDLILKQYIEQIFTDLHLRISNPSSHHQTTITTTATSAGATNEVEDECATIVTVAD